MPQPTDEGALRRERAAVFGRGAADYDKVGTPVGALAGRRLVELAGIAPGDSVLDVATGRGAVLFPAAEAVGPSGTVLGIDLAREMVELTAAELRERGISNASVEVGDAESIEHLGTAAFDRVTCAFAVFFLPNPAAALRGFAGAVRPGGTVAISSWGEPDATYSWYAELRERHGIPRVSIETQPFERPEELRGALEHAGLEEVRVTTEQMTLSLSSTEEWWRWVHTTAGRASLDSIGADERERFRRAAYERIRELYPGGRVELSETAIFAVARRPMDRRSTGP